MTPEGKIKEKVKEAITKHFPDAYRFMPVQMGMGDPGLDFFYCIHGLFVAIETKAPGKHLTERQKYTIDQIVKADGFAFVIRNDLDIGYMLQVIQMERMPDDEHTS